MFCGTRERRNARLESEIALEHCADAAVERLGQNPFLARHTSISCTRFGVNRQNLVQAVR